MKIKGAFPVRWAAKNGIDGKGVTIVKTEIKYAVSTSGTTKPSSGWQTTIPSVSDGNYLWTWTHVEYSDGTKTDAYSVSRHGIDGKGIKSSVTKYCQKANTNTAPHNFPENEWGDFPTSLTNDYWLYTRTIVTYSDNDTAVSYDVSQIGQGSYYAGCNEYYAVSNSKTEAPSGYPNTKDFVNGVATYANGEVVTIGQAWSTNRPDADTDNPYIWNFEISYDSRGNKYVTRPICIGNFAKGIVSIAETYAISAHGGVPQGMDYPTDIEEGDWTDEHFSAEPTNEKPYQWNKTVTTYNDGSKDTIYHVSAVKGADGKGAIYIDLDNDNDSMLYDGSGNLISGNIVSNIKLYDNGKDATSGRTFSIDSSSGVSGSISGSTLTVTGMAANSGYVIVKCIYNSVPYYARFTCKKIIGSDKYEIVCTPSAIIINDDTDTESQVTVTIQVYKTAQNGTRSLLLNLPKGYLLVRKSQDIHTTGTSIPYSNGNATFKPDKNLSNRYRIELLDAGKNVLDYETIPINHTKNGEDACYYKLSPSLDALSFARNSDGGYAPSSIDIYCGYIKVVGSSRTAYAGNNVDNVWKIDGKYEIMWRYHRTDGTVSGWDWNKDSSNGTITVYGLSSNTAIEFIFTSAAGISYVDDSNIFDRVIVPIMREGAKGYSGAKPYFLKFSEIKGKEVKVYQGVGDEEWYTIVYDDVKNTGWYTPKSTHITETDEVLTNEAKWLKSSMNFVATSVFFAQMAYIENLGVRNVLLSDGSTIEGGMCHSDKNDAGESLGLGDVRFWLGSSNPTEGKIRGYRDGTFVAAGGKAVFDKDGNTTIANLTATNGNFTGVVNATSGSFTGEVNATSGSFSNVKISGSMRCAFKQPTSYFDEDFNDCVSLFSAANRWEHPYSLPWDETQSGRRITLVNWKFGADVSTGWATLNAPDGKFFFEHDIGKGMLILRREVVELLGYGTPTEFYGWIVMRRENIMTEHKYGRYQRVLFWGMVRYYSENDVRLFQKWYDGHISRASVARLSEGLYEISFPSGIVESSDNLAIMATGVGYVAGTTDCPCKATLIYKTNTSFRIAVSDDYSKNDGNFDFFVVNLDDWL